MGEFKSLVMDIPTPQAGCFATERVLQEGSGKAAHPCQKPLRVVNPFIERLTDEGQTVLDPFMGSGTTLVASELLGREGIGVEISPEYFDIACRRVEKAVRNRELAQAQLTLTGS